MPQKPSIIRCPKCGYEPNILTDTCIRCSAKLEKLCGTCGFSNAVEKNYCDQCGGLLAMKPAAAHDPKNSVSPEAGSLFFNDPGKAQEKNPPSPAHPHLEMQPIQDTVNEREASYRTLRKPEPPKMRSGPAAEPQFKPAPPPTGTTAPGSQMKTAPQGGSPSATGKGPGRINITQMASRPFSFLQKYQSVLFGLTVAAAALLAAYFFLEPSIPGFMLKRAATGYLEQLSSGHYREAYDLLSTNSKAVCSAEDYIKHSKDYYSKFPHWQFKDVEIFAMGKNAAMIKYQLREGMNPWQPDYISFVHENGTWTRPYIWTLFAPIDAALDRRDFAQALFLAQKLYLTDPIDPRTSGYLCISEFFMKIYNKSEESCGQTLVAAKTYPVGFLPEEILGYRLYYAESLRFLEKFELAIREYNAMINDNRLSQKEQCPLYISRADAFVRLRKYENALDDTMKAGAVCEGEVNKKESAERLHYLNGDAKPEAIAFVQRSRFSPDQPPLLEARKRELSDLAAKLGPRKAKFLPKDTWLAAHISGPEYRVTLREETLRPGAGTAEIRDIMVFNVNLWTARAKIEKNQVQNEK